MQSGKRLWLLIVMVMVTAALFLGPATAAPVKIRFQWAEQPAFVDQMMALINEFNKTHPDIQVELEQVAAWQDKLAVAFAGGAAPDVVIVFSGNVRGFASNGMLLDLSRYASTQHLSSLHPAQRALITQNEAIVALPFTLTTIAMLYDENAISKAGLPTPPTDPMKTWTWSQFRDVSKKLRQTLAGGNENSTVVGAALGSGDFWRLPWFYQNGASLFNAGETRAAINSTQAAQALSFLQEMYTEKLGNYGSFTAITSGTAGLAISGHWDISRVLDASPEVQIGATYLPYNLQQAVGLGGDYVAVMSTTKYPQEAATFVSYLTSRAATMQYSSALNYMSPWRAAMPKYSSRVAPLMPVFYQQALVASPKLVTDRGIPGYSKIVPILQREFAAAVEGRKSPSAALEAMETEFNATLFSGK